MTKRPRPSTPRLSEVARHLVIPDGITSSVWPRCERRLAAADVEFDPWQQGLATVALGCDDQGLYAATVGGVTISIPRQVGKTFTIGHLLIALAIEFPGLRIVWTSHHARTTTNTFRALQGLVRKPKMAMHLDPKSPIRVANGEQEIRFRNGSIFMFGAREHGFGRGMDAIDIMVFDEAQILSLKALEDMVPATNQARNPHGALVLYMGTPPRPEDDGEAFGALRDAALDGSMVDGVYVELSADPKADPDDRRQWAKANPSYPHRTPEASMLRMRRQIPDDASWWREALGRWDDLAQLVVPSVFDLERWAAGTTTAAPDGAVAYGVKFSPDGELVALAVAVQPPVGPAHFEGVEVRSVVDGTRWLIDWLAARSAPVAVDGRSGSGALVKALCRAGVPARRIHRTTTDEAIAAAAGLVDAVTQGDVTHLVDAAMDPTVVVRRPIGKTGGWGFAGRDGEDVSLFDAAALAVHLVAGSRQSKPTGARRVVMPA